MAKVERDADGKRISGRVANAYHPDGTPKYVRIYDDGGPENDGTQERYTVVFTRRNGHGCQYIGMTEFGSCAHGDAPFAIDRPGYAHLGKKITFLDLGHMARNRVLTEYAALWG